MSGRDRNHLKYDQGDSCVNKTMQKQSKMQTSLQLLESLA